MADSNEDLHISKPQNSRFALAPAPTIEHFIPPPSYCLLADLCNHSWVPECGRDYADPEDLRTFRDECDMFEFNCDYDREYEVTNYSACFRAQSGCPPCHCKETDGKNDKDNKIAKGDGSHCLYGWDGKPPSYCLLADLCNHSWVPECGRDYADPEDLRTFRDECDMFEFNCDYDREYGVTNYSECFKAAEGCPDCRTHKCEPMETPEKKIGRADKSTTTLSRQDVRRYKPLRLQPPQSKGIQIQTLKSSPLIKPTKRTVVLKRETIFRDGVKLWKVIKGVFKESDVKRRNRVRTGIQRGIRRAHLKSVPKAAWRRGHPRFLQGSTAGAAKERPLGIVEREIDTDTDFLE